MNTELETCDLTCASDDLDNGEKITDTLYNINMDSEQPIFSALTGHLQQNGTHSGKDISSSSSKANPATSAATTSDTESGISSGESELCVEHESELDWFCGTEQKRICSHCAIEGSCQGHSVTPLATRATVVRVSAPELYVQII